MKRFLIILLLLVIVSVSFGRECYDVLSWLDYQYTFGYCEIPHFGLTLGLLFGAQRYTGYVPTDLGIISTGLNPVGTSFSVGGYYHQPIGIMYRLLFGFHYSYLLMPVDLNNENGIRIQFINHQISCSVQFLYNIVLLGLHTGFEPAVFIGPGKIKIIRDGGIPDEAFHFDEIQSNKKRFLLYVPLGFLFLNIIDLTLHFPLQNSFLNESPLQQYNFYITIDIKIPLNFNDY